jgi:hypothetical protein
MCQNGGGLYPSSRQDRQSRAPGMRVDFGGRSRGSGTAPDRTCSEAKDGTPALGRGDGGAIAANDAKHASFADPDRLAGRGICVERQVLLPGHQAPATCKGQITPELFVTPMRVLRDGAFFSNLLPRALPCQRLFHSTPFTRL